MKKQRIISVAALAALTTIAAGLIWTAAMASQSLTEATIEATPPHIDQSSDTLKLISDSLVIAKRDNKRVLLQFTTKGCTWCHLLENLYEKDERIAAELKSDYLIVKVDLFEGNNKSVDDKYGTLRHNGVPFTVILDSDGKQLLAQNIAFADKDLLSHGIPRVIPDKVLDVLKMWSPKKDVHAA